MKLMVIDDERLVRRGLQSVIDWASYGFSIVAEAEDGQEGLQKILDVKPDIVLLDIRMPVLNGTELMRMARSGGFKGRFILLSGYADFNYAMEAIKMGATDYLLKPVDEQELLCAVLKAESSILKENIQQLMGDQSLSQLRASLLEGMLRGRIAGNMETMGLPARREPFRLMLASCQNKRMQEVAHALHTAFGSGCPIAQMEKCVVVLLHGREAIAAHLKVAVAIKERFPEVLLFISDVATDPSMLHTLYQKTFVLLDHAWFYQRPDVVVCDYRQHTDALGGELARVQGEAEWVDILFYTVKTQDEGRLRERMLQLWRALSWHRLDREKTCALLLSIGNKINDQFVLWQTLNDAQRDEKAYMERITLSPSLFDAVECLQAYLLKAMAGILKTTSQSLQQIMLNYIDHNYDQPLRIKNLAQMLGYDSAYLGKLIKKETGLSFNDYLLNVRLAHACECLGSGMMVSQVAQCCGFGSVEYFSSQFRKVQGCTPSHYKTQTPAAGAQVNEASV